MGLITLKDLSKSYITPTDELHVLRKLNFEINDGELIAITGESGSGKSTLLHIIGGLDSPTSGEALFRGENIYRLDSVGLDNYRNKHIGFVFQFHYLLDDFTAVENVAIPAVIAGQSMTEAKIRAAELLERVRLGNRMNHHPKELSGGEQQRVSVARALMNRPTLILADEPTGNLDKANSDGVQELLFDLKKDGMAVVIVTHDLNIASRCDRVLELFKA